MQKIVSPARLYAVQYPGGGIGYQLGAAPQQANHRRDFALAFLAGLTVGLLLLLPGGGL